MGISAPVALITGAAKRIGATIANQLHSEGYRVIVHYDTSVNEAQTLVNTLNAKRPNSAQCVQANLCSHDEIEKLAKQALLEWNRLDLLVNNASSFYPTPVGSITENDWLSLVGSNLKGPLFLTQALAPELAKTNGSVINMVDMHIDRPLPKHSVYLLAKSGLASLTKSLATELAPNVRVNGIGPGAILWPERTMEESEKQKLIDTIPLGRLGSPKDIADTVCFFINAPYITGQILYVDGGRSLYTSASA